MPDDIPETVTVKTCTKCGEPKPLDAFHPKRKGSLDLRSECRACCSARAMAWKLANPTKAKAADAAFRARPANAERKRRYMAAYWSQPEALERKAERRASNIDRERQYGATYRKSHPEKYRESGARRRARKRNAPVVEMFTRVSIWERDGGICHLCRGACDPEDWHMDHLVPLSKGGPHTAANVAVSHPRCNLSRGASDLPAFPPSLCPKLGPSPVGS